MENKKLTEADVLGVVEEDVIVDGGYDEGYDENYDKNENIYNKRLQNRHKNKRTGLIKVTYEEIVKRLGKTNAPINTQQNEKGGKS